MDEVTNYATIRKDASSFPVTPNIFGWETAYWRANG